MFQLFKVFYLKLIYLKIFSLFREFIELSKFCSKHFVTLVPAIDVGAHEKHITVKDCITEPAHQLMSLFSSK